MLTVLSTRFCIRQVRKALWLITCCYFFTQFATAQVITVPASNPNDSSNRKPLGCFYGYERTAMLYTSSEIGQGGSITKVGFYLNSKNNPAAATPVIIRMKSVAPNSFTSSIYYTQAFGSTQVFNGVITSDMLTADNWVTIELGTAFNYSSNNLLVLVETNYGEFGGENYDAKLFRQSTTTSYRCQFWEDDLIPPADYGTLIKKRPAIQLTFEANCVGTPNPGNTLSTSASVCVNEPFTLSLQNAPTTPGLSYVWQYSPDGNDPWTTIPGATASTLVYTQSTANYYHCKVTCNAGGATGTSNSLLVGLNPFYECYCASYAADISDSKINSFQMADISTSSSPGTCESYTDYTAVPGNVSAGELVTMKIDNGSCSGFFYDSYVGVYIDYNQNGVYEEATELVYGYGPVTDFNSIPDYTFIFPTVAPGGVTGMRVIVTEGDSIPYACGEYTYGETEDYLLNITAATACTGSPSPGATLATQSSVCPDELFELSIANYETSTGISYQWQSSLTDNNYNNINGATSATRTQSQTVATWYRCKVTCDNSGEITFSTGVQVNMNPFYACYCASYALKDDDTKIDTIKIGNQVFGTSPAACETYTDNTAIDLQVAKSGPVTIQIDNGACTGQFYEAYVAVYIDYNQNNVYNANELVYSYGPTTDLHSIPDGVFTIPGVTQLGKTGMRIIIAEGEAVPAACGTYEFGETEDFAINIVDQPPCLVPPNAGVASASVQSFCAVDVPAEITLTLTENSTGLGQTYQWESSADNVIYTPLAGQTDTTATVTVTATTYYRCKVTCSGNSAYSVEVMVLVKATPTGNTQLNPIVITTLPYIDTRDNLSSNCWTSDYTNITQQPSPDVFYSLSLTDTSGTLEISTCETTSGFNSYVHLITEAGVHQNSNDNNGVLCTGNNASIKFYEGNVPINLFIVVEGHATDEGNYTLTVNFIPDSATGVVNSPAIAASNFSIYPNPTDGNVTVQLNLNNDANKVAALNLYNTIGQLVQTEKVTLVQGQYNGSLQLNTLLANGVYNLQLNDGATVISKPIVIQR